MRRNGATRGAAKMTKQGENTCPVLGALSLELSTGTAAASSRSSKKPSGTPTGITGIYCYLRSGISMYSVLHMVQRDTRPELQLVPHWGREGSWLPSRFSKKDRWGSIGPPHQNTASVLQLGQHINLPLGFTLDGDRAPCWWEKSLLQQLLQ